MRFMSGILLILLLNWSNKYPGEDVSWVFLVCDIAFLLRQLRLVQGVDGYLVWVRSAC